MAGEAPGGARRTESAGWLLCAGSVAAAALLSWSDSDAYRFLVGDLDPVLTTLAVCAAGLVALRILSRAGWISGNGLTPAVARVAVLLGAVLTIPVVIVDVLGGFPSDINVTAPASFAFYPAIALVAELVFHAVPLALFVLVGRRLAPAGRAVRRAAIVVVALIEPALQVLWGLEHSPVWANAYVGAHLLAFNAIALFFFTRHGLVAVYVFRLSYYAIWHVLWGQVRLTALFGA